MAMEDYYTGSQFGKVAGSLLRRRERDWGTALGVSVLSNVLENLNLNARAEQQSNIEKTKEEYASIFSNNQDIWEANEDERAFWRKYQASIRRGEAAEKSWLNTEAIERFNKDEVVQRDIAPTNAQSQINKGTPESKEKALELFNTIRDNLKDELEGYRKNRAITAPTRTKFNQAALNELNAQLDIYEDDPAKQNVIFDTFGNIFGLYNLLYHYKTKKN